jgi:hypothetical protein
MTDHRPLANIYGYRDVEYGTHPGAAGEYVWTYYPKLGTGEKTQGTVKGDKDAAVKACKAAIDAWLGPAK